jgi:hypothetical protein
MPLAEPSQLISAVVRLAPSAARPNASALNFVEIRSAHLMKAGRKAQRASATRFTFLRNAEPPVATFPSDSVALFPLSRRVIKQRRLV